MDGSRFDTLSRSLAATRSRRGALAMLLGGTLGLLSLTDTAAKKGKRKRTGKGRKKRKQKRPAAATCSDGIKNGSETGVDCGGSCSRCGTGQGCTSPNDCAGAFCSGGTCQTCTMDGCGTDGNGACICRGTDPPTSNVCVSNSGTITDCPSTPCPPGQICINNVGIRACYKPCGAP